MPKFIRKSQIPPPPPDPAGNPFDGGAPIDMGAPPMPPIEEPEGAGEDIIIPGPLDSSEKILLDSRIRERLADADDIQDICEEVWEDYGGKSSGGVFLDKKGMRTEKHGDRTKEETLDDEENGKEPRDKLWLRLPQGDTIADITSIEDLYTTLKRMLPGLMGLGSGSNEQGAGGGPPLPF